ncbi:hypothetical protein M758_UG189800 [Ceratodon purpureus]|nr:hypothetical protein M758_UG189800 [Ceratodon purpureus]
MSSANSGTYRVELDDWRWHMRCLYGETDGRVTSEIVKVLQAKSLVEFNDVATIVSRSESIIICVHDLYREFATIELEKKGLQHSRSCCLSRGSKRRRFVQEV